MLNPKKSLGSQTFFLVFLIALIGGGTGAFAKISLEEITPLSLGFLRFLLAAGIFLPLVIRKKVSWAKIKKLFPLSLLCSANVIFYIFGVQKTTATISQMLYASSPLIIALLSLVFLKEKLYLKRILGIITGALGVALIIFLPLLNKSSIWNGDLFGNILILIAILSFSFYVVLSKKLQGKFTPLELVVSFIFTTAIIQFLLLPFDFISQNYWWPNLTLNSILGLLYLVVFATAISYFLTQYAIKISTPVIFSMTFYLQPILGYLWASVLLGERITFEFIIGALLAFIGVALVTSFNKDKPKSGDSGLQT